MFVEVRPTPDLFGFILHHSLVIEELAGVGASFFI
jgi:hypothetical protein